jgi:DNA-damage-inducible protein J
MVRMTTTMTFKIDKEVKAQAQATAKKMGIPLSTLINAYLRDIAATGRVEFTATEQMTPQMERIIQGFKEELKKGDLSPTFDDTEEAIEYLKARVKKYRK